MSLSDLLHGTVGLEIRAAWPEAVLNACMEHGIVLRRVVRRDACTFQVEIDEHDLKGARELVQTQQGETEILAVRGGKHARKWFQRRAILFFSLLTVVLFLIWSNLHIWEIDVYGCEDLTRGQVLRALEESGVSVGCYWPRLSVESVRSHMLLRMPDLAWMTVNVSGSHATVWVVERLQKPTIYDADDAADVVASVSGILRELTVLNGHPLVSRGNAVEKGDTLVTGAMDSLSHPTRYVRAEARAMADTWYEWTAMEPPGKKHNAAKKYIPGTVALQFGKKRVNLFGRSRKELDGYDKIVHEYTVGVNGLFRFPVSLIREEFRSDMPLAAEPVSTGERLRNLLAEQIDGEILQSRVSVLEKDGFCYTTLRAHCLENIAQTAEIDQP